MRSAGCRVGSRFGVQGVAYVLIQGLGLFKVYILPRSRDEGAKLEAKGVTFRCFAA